jgi:Flp pilus assembly protein TadD
MTQAVFPARASRFAVPAAASLLLAAALTLIGQDFKTLIAKGDTLYEAGKNRQALAVFDQAIRLRPRDSEAHRKRGLC